MRRTASTLLFSTAVLVMTAASNPATAQRRQSTLLPPFEVTTLDERTVTIGESAFTGHRLIVLVGPDCGPCDQIVRAVAADQTDVASRTVLIYAGASANQLKVLAEQFPSIPTNAWHRDPELRALESLGVSRVPAIVALRGRSIDWTLTGVLLNESTLGALLSNWVSRGPE
jgi:hypothetical protein